MKRFECGCGQRLFFEDYRCLGCSREVGFAPGFMTFLSRGAGETAFLDASGRRWKVCANRAQHRVCNWLVAADDDRPLCRACRLNRVIPNLESPSNLDLWSRMERAKRRLVYSLISLGLPIDNLAGRAPLAFEFMEDRRRNPRVAESFVMTGHRAGVITINLLEADDSARHAVREEMRERYRTLLGHFRHESGHYYWDWTVPVGEPLEEFRRLFGDERGDYQDAVRRYYWYGPAPAWHDRFVSAYASAHPIEDWAECWAHYLHIVDGLETARANGLLREDPSADWEIELATWMDGSVKLNELNRSLGTDDPYPFVLNSAVRQKLRFIHRRLAAATAGEAAVGAR